MADAPSTSNSRRDFLMTSSVAAVGAVVARFRSPQRLRGRQRRNQDRPDRLRRARHGRGGQQALGDKAGVKLVAVGDAFENRMPGTLKKLKKRFGERVDVPEERQFVGFDAYQKVIDAGATW